MDEINNTSGALVLPFGTEVPTKKSEDTYRGYGNCA